MGLKKGSLIYIEWADAVSSGSNWTDEDNIEEWIDGTEWVIKQCGWILHEDKTHLTIYAQIKPEDKFTCTQYGHIQKIPKPWIIKKVDLSKYIK